MGLLVITALVLSTPAVLDAGWGPFANRSGGLGSGVTGLPVDAPELGLVYQGLAPAPKGAPCAGSFQLGTRDTCTHGPDQSPPGLVVARDVKPIAPATAAPAPLRRDSAAVPGDADVARDAGAVSPDNDTPALVPDAAPADEPFVAGANGVACTGDGHTGQRIQVLYLYEFGAASRYAQYLESIRTWAAGVDAIFAASAAETGGVRRLRYSTTPDCRVDVAEVQVPAGSLDSFETNIDALRKLGYNRTDRKYLLFADTNVYCGISTFVGDRRPGASNRNNAGPSYGRTDAGCWSAAVAAHELTHSLGAVLPTTPHSSKRGHCTDGYDLMCYQDARTTRLRVVCPDQGHQRRLDCNHDDYFHTSPRPGTYLAQNWNVADSDFLVRQNDTRGRTALPTVAIPSAEPSTDPRPESPDDDTGAEPAPSTSAEPTDAGAVSAAPTTGVRRAGERGAAEPAASTQPTGAPAEPAQTPQAVVRAAPSPSAEAPADARPAPQPPPSLEPVLQTSEPTSTAVRLVWNATERGGRFAVLVDGNVVATTAATRARLIGLRPDTTYQVQIRLVEPRPGPFTAPVAVRTAPAAQPAPGSWFILANALTGTAADLYAARTAAGTPLVLNRPEGGAQQQWKLLPAGDGSFQMVSKASGKCVLPLRSNPVAGAPLVQGTCAEGDPTQRWSIGRSDHGFTLRTVRGDLVVGLGSQRFGASRVLALREPDDSRHQSWTALPG